MTTDVVPSVDAPEEPPAPPRRRWYKRPRNIVLIVLGVLAIAGGLWFWNQWGERGAEEVPVGEELEECQKTGRCEGEGSLLRPHAGVYTYAATGTEKLSVLDTTQEWGPTVPVSVTHGNGGAECWTLKIAYSTNHWQATDYCPRDRVLYEEAGRTFQSFDFVAFTVDDLNEFKCDPASETLRLDAKPDDTWRASCAGASEGQGTEVTSAGTNTFVGVETLVVAGTDVETLHYRGERTLSGDQSGDETSDTWYRATDGLPVKMTHDIRVESPAPPPLNSVVYTEVGTLELTALDPVGG